MTSLPATTDRSAVVHAFLNSLEQAEATLLAWGVVDGGFAEDELEVRAQDFLETCPDAGYEPGELTIAEYDTLEGKTGTLAQTLRSEGFPAQVATVTRAEPLHVVRIGGYPDRAKASAARQELQGKGHPGFVTQGPAK